MSRIGRPSPAMIVAIIALIVAIGGTAVALPGRQSVLSKDLRTGSVGARALGKVLLDRGVDVRSTDPVRGDGQYTPASGTVRCPRQAPFALDPFVSGMNELAYVASMRSSRAGNRFGGPGSYLVTILSDAGPDHLFRLQVNCLPRR